MKKSIDFFVVLIGIFSYGLIPIPLFFDLVDFKLVLTTDTFPILKAPLPVGMMFFSVGLIICHILNLFNNNFVYFVSGKRLRYTLFSFSLILFVWLYFLSDIDFLKIIQIMLPLFGAIFFIYPKDIRLLNVILNFTVIVAVIYFTLHLVSLYLNNSDFLKLTELDFPFFFGNSIYQSLVSYPGVIFIYFCIVFYLSIRNINTTGFLYTLFCMVLLSLLGFAARRASVFELLILFFILLVVSSIYLVKYKMISKKILYYIFFLFPFLILFFYGLTKFPLGQRFTRTYQTGEFDSGRLDIYQKAFSDFSNNLGGLFFGQSGKSGYHNYFLDMLYNIGILPILIFFSMIFLYFIYDFKKILNYFSGIDWFSLEVILIAGCFSGFLVQSMVNASITQPYYLINLLVLVLYYIVKRKGV